MKLFLTGLSLVFMGTLTAFASPLQNVRLTSGTPDRCATILDAIANKFDATLTDVPASLRAGQTLSLNLAMHKSFNFSETVWDQEFSFAYVYMSTQTPYPKGFTFAANPDLFEYMAGRNADGQFTLTRDIPASVAATFTLHFKFVGTIAEQGLCIVDGDFGKAIEIASDHPDMFPPFVMSISFDKSSYTAGDQVVARMTLSEPLAAPESNHIEFDDPALPDGVGYPGFLPDSVYHLDVVDNGVYVIRFTLPANAKPGNYVLSWFNRQDAVGNFADRIGTFDQQEKHIAAANPLVIQ